MILEAVTVCINYGDYLRVGLAHNASQLNKLVVVTTKDDDETRSVISDCGLGNVVECLVESGGAPFNKGKFINTGLRMLDRSDWLLHLDSDIVFPVGLRKIILGGVRRRDIIYGIHRTCTSDPQDVERFLSGQSIVGKIAFRDSPKPVGYFQLWHATSNPMRKEPWYPDSHESVTRSDVEFTRKFPSCAFIRNAMCLHLGVPVVNWRGRVSGRWGGGK